MPGPSRLPDLPLWEPHWTASALAARRAFDKRMFARGFAMVPFADDERIFPSVTSCYSYNVSTGDWARSAMPKVLGVDISSDTRPGNALVAVGLDPGTRRRHLIRAVNGAWTSPQLAAKIQQLDDEFHFRVILVESNGVQKAIVDWLRQVKSPCWTRVRPFETTGKNKHDPELGVRSLEVEFSNQAWVIPAAEFEGHAPSCTCGWCVWRREFEEYPMGSTTDMVMSTWFARQAINLFAAPVGATRVEGLHDR